ncbi:hypothetical protein NRA39_10470 [Acinetobacter baumannii]|nr:hypothetical protein [Acinetobacter baumannii]
MLFLLKTIISHGLMYMFKKYLKLILAILFTLFLFSAIVFFDQLPSGSTAAIDFSPILSVIAFVIALIITVASMSRYLDPESKVNDLFNLLTKFIVDDLYEPKSSKKEIKNKVEDCIEELSLADKNVEEITNLVRDKLENLSAESYFNEFKQKVKIDSAIENFENKTKSIELRVQGEIRRLSKSGVINLSIGMLLSVSGLLYLGSFVVNVQSFTTIEGMIVNTFPKTIFVLLIEVFSYFFLKLYKQNLDDIKYYQNELTNIESKNLAVQIAKQSNNHKLITLCVEEFLRTERNFILEKDQSTIEIEKERINSNNNSNLLMALKDLVKPK